MKKRSGKFALLLVSAIILVGCSGIRPSVAPVTTAPAGIETSSPAAAGTTAPAVAPTSSPISTPEPPAAEVRSVAAALDSSLAAADIADPYAVMNRYDKAILKPDPDLYNLLYRAIDEMKPSVDVSKYHVTPGEMASMFTCLFAESDYRFYYLRNVKLSKDGKTALITYNGDSREEIERNKETFMARLSHLVYNVAPQGYTDLQKVLSVYEYICENSNYTDDMQDATTYSPYSVLMKGKGICNGFASLVDYVLNRAGVPTEYVVAQNQAHAWDLVTVGGEHYYTDVTFGASVPGSTANELDMVLMDDSARKQTLLSNNVDPENFIIGYSRENPETPPPCTDTRFAAYNDVGFWYALDIDGGKVYFAAQDGGIKRMNLDCTGLETLSATASPSFMVVCDGVVYYLSSDSGQLFKLLPDGSSEMLDDTKNLAWLTLVDGSLRYSVNYDGSDYKTIRLTDFDPKTWDAADTVELPAASVPRSRTFAAQIEFSEPMDTAADWKSLVTLADSQGNPLPIHLFWSQDGKTLSVRSAECVADLGSVTVHVKSGAPSVSGGKLAKGYTMRVDVKAGK